MTTLSLAYTLQGCTLLLLLFFSCFLFLLDRLKSGLFFVVEEGGLAHCLFQRLALKLLDGLL